MTTTQAERQTRRNVAGAWLLPTLAVAIGGGFAERNTMEGHAAFFVVLLGVVAGALWQLLHRRDLADRFTLTACLVLVSAAFLAIAPSGYLLANSGPGHALAGVFAGVVLTEQFLRTRA